jgi:hypothetical protein
MLARTIHKFKFVIGSSHGNKRLKVKLTLQQAMRTERGVEV